MSELEDYRPRERLGQVVLNGKYVRVEPIDWDVHGDDLNGVMIGMQNADLWTYMPIGPFEDIQACKAIFSQAAEHLGWETMCIVSQGDNSVLGMASYMRLRPQFGSAEVGCVVFGKSLQRTKEATEAMYLMARHLFEDLGYRRYEWKCDNSNKASKRAAERYGFAYEGLFRNDMILKGRNRDTAWFSIIDAEWPRLAHRFKNWLAEENFDDQGQQKKRLQDCT